jgi:transposase-like protein
MRRKITDERDARACLKAAKAAGLTAGEWAREHGVDGRSLNAWRINLAERGASSGAPHTKTRLVELVPTSSVGGIQGRYVVRVADAEIEVTDEFRAETLVRLVRALRSC